jgi:putative inorganic carbon (hco3(-)) transporter
MTDHSLSRRLHYGLNAPLVLYFIAAGIVAGVAMVLIGPVQAGAVYLLAGVLIFFVARMDLCVLFLLLVRSSLDFSTEYSLVSLAPAAKLNIAAVLNLLLIVSGTIYLAVKGTSVWRLPGARFLGIFLLLPLLTFNRIPSLPTAVADWLRNLSCLVLYAVVATVFVGRRKVETAVGVILLSAVVPVFVGFYEKATAEVLYNGIYRIHATFFHPNAYGLYLILISILTYLLLHLRQTLLRRAGLLLLLLCCSLSLLWTLSRGAWIAALVAIGLITVVTRWRSAFAALGTVVALVALLPQIPQRFEDVASPVMQGSFQWRVWLWTKMVSFIGSHPVLGYGLGSFYFYSEGWAAHNDYLRLAFETGILGLALYLLSVFSVGFFALRQIRKDADPLTKVLSIGFVAILSGFLVASGGENVMMMPVLQWYLWALAGLVVSLGTRGEEVAGAR